MNEAAYLAFMIGMSIGQYDPRYLRTKSHISEVVDVHCRRLALNPSPEALALVTRFIYEHFNK